MHLAYSQLIPPQNNSKFTLASVTRSFNVIKLILEEMYISQKLRTWQKKFGLMSETARNCENNECSFKQNCTLKLFIAFKCPILVDSVKAEILISSKKVL